MLIAEEIVELLADSNPIVYVDGNVAAQCGLCGATVDYSSQPIIHEDNCVWMLAKTYILERVKDADSSKTR